MAGVGIVSREGPSVTAVNTAPPEVQNPGKLGMSRRRVIAESGGGGGPGEKGPPASTGGRSRPSALPAPPFSGKGHVARLAGRPGACRKDRPRGRRRHPRERLERAGAPGSFPAPRGGPSSGPGSREDLVSRGPKGRRPSVLRLVPGRGWRSG